MPISLNSKAQKISRHTHLLSHTGFVFSKEHVPVKPEAIRFEHADGRVIEINEPEWVMYSSKGKVILEGTDLDALRKIFVNHMTREELMAFMRTMNSDT